MIFRLPEDALVRSDPQTRARLAAMREWDVRTELLAQILEEVSILAAEHRRPKPREVPRPQHVREPGGGAQPQAARTGVAHAVAVLKATRRRVVG